MPDYGELKDKLIIRQQGTAGSSDKPGVFLFRSGSLRDSSTAVSASVPHKLAVTCSANTDNVLTKLTNTNAYAYITLSNGRGGIGDAVIGKGFIIDTFPGKVKETRLVLRYISSSYTSKNKLISSSKHKNDYFINIPIKNNDDSFSVAYKTVNALNKKGQGLLYTASLVDTGNSLSNLSASLGENMTIGSSFKIRSGSLISGSIDVAGKFILTNLNSGSVKDPDFSGTKVQVGEMKIGSTFKITDTDPLFKYNIIQSGSGRLNNPFYKGDFKNSSQSLSIELDPDDKTSAIISGSGKSKVYFSGSGKIGIGTTNPQKDLDIDGDLNISQNLTISNNLTVEGTITANAYIVTESITTVTSGSTIFGNSADDSHIFTGHITASGNISASNTMRVSDSGYFIGTQVPPVLSLESSRLRVSGSNDIFYDTGDDHIFLSEGTEIVHIRGDEAILEVTGDLDVSGEIECDHLNIADVDDGIHFGNTPVLFIDGDNNVNFGVDGNAVVDLELYGHNHTYTAGGSITLDAGGDITLDAAGDQVRFKDAGTTKLTIDTSAGHITASGNISASGTSHTFGANVKISAGTSGDATLTLESDTDNNVEADNPYINFLQDGGDVEGFIGLSGNDGKWPSGESLVNLTSQNTSNALILGTTSSHGDAYRNVILVSRQTASLFVDGGSVIASGDISSETGTVLAGWHGSTTRIKILVSDFIPDDIGRPAMIDDTGSDRWLESHSTGKLFASIPIPTGFKATHVRIYGSGTAPMVVYEANIDSKTVTSVGVGNIGTEKAITNITSDDTNYVFIELAQTSGEEVYGGYITITAV